MPELRVIQGGKLHTITFHGAPLLGMLLVSHAYGMQQPCGGRGVCGKCAVQAKGALSPMTEAEIKTGTRLSCQTILLGDAEVILPDRAALLIETDGTFHEDELHPMPGRYGAAVDIGTTTLALKLFDLSDGHSLGLAAILNPQTQIAADVIGRIGAGVNGAGKSLQSMVEEAIQALLYQSCVRAAIPVEDVSAMVVTGNTAMLYLLTGRNPECLSHAPFRADTLFGETSTMWGKTVLLPPCMDAFVGADISCAVLASGMMNKAETALLMDVGTNGEIALWHDGKLYVVSTAAGPAFEGAGISCGCGAIPGAIDQVAVVNGRLHIHTIQEVPAVGLCGSGLLDAVAALLEIGRLDETGALEEDLIPLSEGLYLTQADVRQVQLAKGAIAAGIKTMLHEADITEKDVGTLYIAGGFGSHLNIRSAVAIGLMPGTWADRAIVLGNAALSGAAMLLRDTRNVPQIQRIAKASRTVQLGGNAVFFELFMNEMMF